MTRGNSGAGDGSGADAGERGADEGGARPLRTEGSAGMGAHIHIVRFAPAKLNLTLAVLGRRADGYHSLHSVMVPLLLGDALTVSVAPRAASGDTLRVSGLAVSAADDNLVLRAIAAVRAALAGGNARTRADLPPLSVRLDKRIPVAAGLGGGSSDAAAAMEAALAAWQTTLSPESMSAVAASLGSDVPFFLAHGAAVITGRGEFVEPLPAMTTEPPALLVVTPGLPVSTPAVFGEYAAGARPADSARARVISETLADRFRTGTTAAALLEMGQELAAANDLLPAAVSVAPELEEFIRKLEKLVGRPVCQSGSGPTQWVMYPTLSEARKAVRLVRLAVARDNLPTIGRGELFAVATAIAGQFPPPADQTLVHAGRADRPRTVHNDPSGEEPHTHKGDDSR
jgi:4-diphosphocytidyl-2-C-methyl-D-erythritol kinase